jgi:hypothetical protein
MRDLTWGTPATGEQIWCDGGNAQISWARHTSHTYHPYFIVRAILERFASLEGGSQDRTRALPELANCRDTHARGDAPSKTGRFQSPRVEAVVCLAVDHQRPYGE